MTDLELLTGTIAARVRAMAEIERLYPARNATLPGLLATAAGVVDALTTDQTVHAHEADGTTFITVSIGTASGLPAPATASAVGAAVVTLLDAASVDRREVTIRIASITP